ncbi:hypothetical protein JTE90_008914 [Oedothorax gibbosus]|uniref:C3H1-type domain-containing protein n=1 Tax=Oedothorax gibbosus TaxID=931172 RepID=A0AAV6UK99_9ARAC|nr:hypothetical protein JTE90_008914 [Oedothorax gibbosus]
MKPEKKMETFCSFCSLFLGTEAELVEHCNSETHQLIIMSDEGRDWKFRAPGRGVGSDQYALCPTYSKSGKCRFGALCCDAHGEEELAEWKERFDYRQMKLQGAKECQLQGRRYTEQLLEKWLTASNPSLIMADDVDSVVVNVDNDLNLTVSEKNCAREWVFRLSSKAPLRHIALLYETHRNHFRISHLQCGMTEVDDLGPNCQEWSNPDTNMSNVENYIVKVRFITAIYGTFRQDLVFDFGFEPVLVKKFCVDVVSLSDMEKLQQARSSVISYTERWNSSEVTVVPFENRPYAMGDQEKNLLACYPPPSGNKFTLTHSVMEPTLNENNYCARQHELLCIEEMAQYDLLARYNVQATLNVADRYLLTPNSGSNAKYSHDGELFANMKLSSVLSEDSASGRLVLTNCNTVLLAPVSTKGEVHRKVYEAVIEDKGKTVIYIRLSKPCCEELNIQPDQEFQAEVQFQLNRLPLCEMHFAVDRLHPPSLVFPDINVNPQLWNNPALLNPDLKLNPKQREAVLAITTPLSNRLPPVLIIGPFGTGKTYTLAQAVKMLLDQPEARILVCTHSNSAADIYIREYLHPSVAEGRFEATPLRIYYRHRWVATVHPTVQQYCLIDGSERRFLMPTASDVKKHKVVVTTLSTAKYLVQLGLEKGFFTHILIDEAAQAMECEAIMPLSLASENTRIVLAGDHMQLSPEGYSDFAKQRNLHTSLLERLYDLYPEDFGCKVLLCENYRSHEAIVQYTSELFYDNHLKASGMQPRHKKYYPLTFFTARGEDVQDCNSTAFHNNAEVYEIVERVIELKTNWPDYWGDQDETSIGVVTPYYDQVVRIRAELRKKKLHGVSVERVLNVQGKQFRVIFLSVVRTRQTCVSKPNSESDLDHGFLSNARLLNTAITRAQSLVAVVGDPVSLCSVGKCRKLWEKFIRTCHEEKSLFGITWDSLLSQLDSMELKKNFILNPLAPEFIPGMKYHGLPSAITRPENIYQQQQQQQNRSSPQPLLLFPVPSPLQGPPIMPMPNPYINNMVNCMVPPPCQPSPFPQYYPFSSGVMPQQIRGSTSNLARLTPPAAFPQTQRKIIPNQVIPQPNSNGGTLEEQTQRDFENGPTLVGRQLMKRNGVPFSPTTVANKPVAVGQMSEVHNQEEMKRMIMNRLEQMGNFQEGDSNHHFPNNHKHFGFEDKSNKLLHNIPKSEELPLKNGMVNSEYNVGLFTEQLQNQKHPVNGVWAPLTGTPEMHHPPQNSYDNHVSRGTPFIEMNGVSNNVDRPHSQYEIPNSVFMMPSPEKWPNANESHLTANPQEIPAPNFLQASLLEKLSLLQKLLPVGCDIFTFLSSEEQTKSFLQLLLAADDAPAAKTFLFLLASIKRDQELLQEAHISHQKKMVNRRLFSPSRNIMPEPNPGMRNLPTFYPHSRPMMGNSHTPEVFNNSEAFPIDMPPMSPFTMSRISPHEGGVFGNVDLNRPKPHLGLSNHQPNHWPPSSENNIGLTNGFRPNHDVPLLELSKLNIENRLTNGEAFQAGEAFPYGNQRRFQQETPEDNFHRMWSSPEFKATSAEQGWQKSSPIIFDEHAAFQTSYINQLRNRSSTVDRREMQPSSSFEVPRMEENPPSSNNSQVNSVITPGPLSMSYPDIPNILTLSPGKEPVSKIIRKPTPRTSKCSAVSSSPFMFNINLPSSHESPLHYPELSSEGMTYAKIVRSPQP